MTLECVYSGSFPFFVMHTILYIAWSRDLWHVLYLLICIQMVGVSKGIVACLIRGNIVMIFTSLYSSLYVTSLLPAKVWAILTIRKRSWGTSGRKTMIASYQALIPVVIWMSLNIAGVLQTIAMHDYMRHEAFYIFYWAIMIIAWRLFVKKYHMTKKEIHEEALEMQTESFKEHKKTAAMEASHREGVDILTESFEFRETEEALRIQTESKEHCQTETKQVIHEEALDMQTETDEFHQTEEVLEAST